MLCTEPISDQMNNLPSPEQLKGKILIKVSRSFTAIHRFFFNVQLCRLSMKADWRPIFCSIQAKKKEHGLTKQSRQDSFLSSLSVLSSNGSNAEVIKKAPSG